ncbi:NADPH-dependent FMN reductase [Streptomyces albidus (ex Kaewkla and Franco 2022)]|uniref:NADPH-dependent FMN reductase n=1 Tax=Streptomyces albidus (ex Kaewkla and Franco 2022) TaxID=722709 RepID=UPI0015EEF6A8|nr:NADPH-dependent FMN reductase [Streptomyces albidus (ex Kaewkla and Franco 2022)]
MPNVLTLSGSPSARSRTASLVRHVGELLADESHDVRHVAVRDLPPEPLLSADAAHPAIREVIDAIAWADALVVGTPVYKAAYSGLLKTLLDLLPQFALAGKTVLPLATGGSAAHVLAIDYALRPVLTSLGTDSVLRGWFVLDRHVSTDAEGRGVVAAEAAEGVSETVDRLIESLSAPARPPRGLATAV